MFDIYDLLGRSAPTIEIVDVGAMWMGKEHLAYRGLVDPPGRARVTGFEPVQAECDKLNALKLSGHRYLPHFIGDGSQRTFHLCNYPMTSSLYEPNTPLLSLFQNLEELTRPVERTTVRTTRLDDIPELTAADLLKIDVQGAELDALRGAERLLASVLFIHTEVEFVPMYTGQPLFADVDTHIRARGFAFHTLSGPMGRAFKPMVLGGNPNLPLRQLLWAEAVYVRDFTRFADLTPEQLIKIAVIAHQVYGSFDLAHLALRAWDARSKAALAGVYMKRLADESAKRAKSAPPRVQVR